MDADHERDLTFRGFIDQVRSNLNHFDPSTRGCAIRINIILEGYGNIVPKPYDEESGLITGLISDLRTKVIDDLENLNLPHGLLNWSFKTTDLLILKPLVIPKNLTVQNCV